MWEPGKSSLEHVWQTSDNGKFHRIGEIHFMDWENAVGEYKQIKNFGTMVDLQTRN